MTKMALDKLTVDELVERFEDICMKQYQGILRRKTAEYNVLYAKMDSVDAELKRRGAEARLALLGLYGHPNVQVRLKAAIRTLAVAPDPAKQVLKEIAESYQFPQAADAALMLDSSNFGSFVPKL